MNPFKYGQVVSGENFCPRPKLIKEIKGFIRSGQNAVLQGERRIGKTSLVFEAARVMKKKRILYIDLLAIKSSDDLCRRMTRAVLSLEQKGGFLEKTLKTLSHMKPSITFDPITGQPTISFDSSVRLKPESIEGLMDLFLEIHERKESIVFFDEFQDILNLRDAKPALALLRSKIQFHVKVPYLFAGSVRNQMAGIFNDPSSPFFKSAVILDVGALDEGPFFSFLVAKFAEGGRSLDSDVFVDVISMADNIPGDIQHFCGALWEITRDGEMITTEHLPKALELIFSQEAKGYEATLVQLTSQQLRCLVGLAKVGGKAPQSSAFLRASGISLPASVKRALDRMEKLKIIFRHPGEYRFVNPFFRSWLLHKGF